MAAGLPAQPLRFGIFADDLTGALDASAPFVVRGFSAYASVTATLPPEFSLRGFSVATVNMDSRRMSPAHAAERAYTAVSDLVEEGYRPAFNKIDSTLRGHIGLEALVAARAGAARGFLVTPAYPANGRTVIDREVRVGGVPVHQTEVGRDALTPVKSSDLTEALRANSGADPAHLALERVRQGTAAVMRALDRATLGSLGRVVAVTADCETDDDLGVIAGAALMKEPDWLLSGSAGLASAVAHHLFPNDPRPGGLDRVQEPYLVVVGSQRKSAAESAGNLARDKAVRLVIVDGTALLDRKTARRRIGSAVATATGHLKAGQSVALLLDAGSAIDTESLAVARDTLVAGVGEIASRVVESRKPNALMIVGGDTAMGVLTALGAAGIVLRDEPLPGTAAGMIDGGEHAGLAVLTKAGAFGDEDTLAALFRYLRQGVAQT